jgi:hypothetical protein
LLITIRRLEDRREAGLQDERHVEAD